VVTRAGIAVIAFVATGCRAHFDDRSDSAGGASLAQRAYIKASNTDAADAFGDAVAISADGTTLAVGAPGEASAIPGIGGNQLDNSQPDTGAVYVFVRSGETWTQQAYIKASNPGSGDQFGLAVALSDDGSTLAVASYYVELSGAVYMFSRTGTTWTQQDYLKASNAEAGDRFGTCALSGDGNTLAVGATREASNSVGIDGTQSDNSAPGAGAVYVFARSGMAWTQQVYVKASNTRPDSFFGQSVALSSDGNILAVGADGERSNARGINADQTDASAPDTGASYVFTRSGTVWTQDVYLKASNADAGDQFGRTVALSADGVRLAVRSANEASASRGVDASQTDNSAPSGAAYVFAKSGGTWTQEAYIKSSNNDAGDGFGVGISINIDGTAFLAGAFDEDSAARTIDGDQSDNTAPDAGAAYLFTRSGVRWTQTHFLKGSNTDPADGFGHRIAISADGTTSVIGVPDEASGARGTSPDPLDNSKPRAGAVYVFR